MSTAGTNRAALSPEALAYGHLWLSETTDHAVKDARATLHAALTNEERRAGIAAALRAIGAMPMPASASREEIVAGLVAGGTLVATRPLTDAELHLVTGLLRDGLVEISCIGDPAVNAPLWRITATPDLMEQPR